MRFIVSFLSFITFLYLPLTFAGTSDTYYFISPIQKSQFYHLISELRCLVCQNQSLAESNAPLARDLKNEVYNQIRLGYTDQKIKHYLVQRYGQYILFKPDVNQITLVLWLGPFVFLSGAFIILLISIKRQVKSEDHSNVLMTKAEANDL